MWLLTPLHKAEKAKAEKKREDTRDENMKVRQETENRLEGRNEENKRHGTNQMKGRKERKGRQRTRVSRGEMPSIPGVSCTVCGVPIKEMSLH